jgi:hypothetical protein
MKIKKVIEIFRLQQNDLKMYRRFSLEVCCLLACDTEYISRSVHTFQSKLLPAISGRMMMMMMMTVAVFPKIHIENPTRCHSVSKFYFIFI